MITIGKIPNKLQSFFRPVKRQVSEHVYSYFWSMVMSICISHSSTIDRLVKSLRNSTHRTNHGEFLWRSNWNESAVMQQIALDTLTSLFNKKDRHLFLIIDDTQTLKRAKKMQAVGKLHHHATGKYGIGHTILKVCLYYRGITIPWASLLYVKEEHASKLEIDFCKLTELAGQTIRDAALSEKFEVTVLFDAFYLCPNVVNACKERKWHYIGVGKSNRWFTIGSVKRKLAKYGRNVLRNSGTWYNIAGLRKSGVYRLAERIGKLNKLGTVKIVFSRRRGENKHIAIVTDNLNASMRTVVADYLKRWSIEMLIKDEKQHLGLGDYRVLRYQAVVRHLHLVDCAYACLTHVGIKTYRAQGQNKSKKVLRLEPISKLKDRVRRIVWQENIQDVIKYSHEKPVIRRLEKLLAA
ncbi:MAG: transposase [Planctomycetota bacterium]